MQPDEGETKELRNHVIIAGYGRVGQMIGQMLSEELIPFVAVDIDANRRAGACWEGGRGFGRVKGLGAWRRGERGGGCWGGATETAAPPHKTDPPCPGSQPTAVTAMQQLLPRPKQNRKTTTTC
jgi:hypothetical protein